MIDKGLNIVAGIFLVVLALLGALLIGLILLTLASMFGIIL